MKMYFITELYPSCTLLLLKKYMADALYTIHTHNFEAYVYMALNKYIKVFF